ncbi:MAG: bifunctional DNA-formamidopyrimidine glycosylase/DNA-(apurinic or apyrimidinic site) lyase [Planctomycetota bacterium]
MPELPEVETVVRTLRPAVVGKRIDRVSLFRDDYATPGDFGWGLANRRVTGVRRRAKRIVIDLCGRESFVVHLGMTGRLTLDEPAMPRAIHTHAVFAIGSKELRLCDPRRFGRLHWIGSDAGEVDARVGPEPLELPAAKLASMLQTTARPLKSALLDQTFIAGLGNIYVDEALHAARLHPLTSCRDVDRPAVGRLSRAIKRILSRAIDAGGSTLRDYVDAAGNAGSFQQVHKVYGRAGEPCRRCRTPIVKFVHAGRGTHVCPTCQQQVVPSS